MIDDDTARTTVAAIRGGDLATLGALLDTHEGLAAARLAGGAGGRTPLHVATDWPGYFPDGPAVVALLVAHGADVDARRAPDGTGETPLHWAASSDDVDVARALLDAGCDAEAPGGSIGTPLDNAVGYGCWHVATLLDHRGVRIDSLWTAAALGRLDRLDALLAADPAPDPDAVSQGFWHACAAGQRRAAQRLLAAGADLAWTPPYAQGTLWDAAAAGGTARDNLLDLLRDLGIRPS